MDKINGQQVIVCRLNKQYIALEAAILLEAFASRPVTEIPFAKDHLDGLIHFNGRIIPQISLSCLLGFDKIATDYTLLLIHLAGYHFALPVSEVIKPLTLLGSDHKTSASDSEEDLLLPVTEAHPLIRYSFVFQGDRAELIDTTQLAFQLDVSETQHNNQNMTMQTAIVPPPDFTKGPEGVKKSVLLLTYHNQTLAVAIDDLETIADCTNPIVAQPDTPPFFLGLTAFNGYALPVLDGFSLLAKTEAPPRLPEAARLRLLVFRYQGFRFSVTVDHLDGLETIKEEEILTLAHSDEPAFKKDDQLINLFETADFFTDQRQALIAGLLPAYHKREEKPEIRHQLLGFTVEGKDFAVAIDCIEAIAANITLTPVPDAPGFLAGTMEFRGLVIPVINAIALLGFTRPFDECLIIRVGQSLFALGVTRCHQILKVGNSALNIIPEDKRSHFAAIAHHNQKMIPVLHPPHFCQLQQEVHTI